MEFGNLLGAQNCESATLVEDTARRVHLCNEPRDRAAIAAAQCGTYVESSNVPVIPTRSQIRVKNAGSLVFHYMYFEADFFTVDS